MTSFTLIIMVHIEMDREALIDQSMKLINILFKCPLYSSVIFMRMIIYKPQILSTQTIETIMTTFNFYPLHFLILRIPTVLGQR